MIDHEYLDLVNVKTGQKIKSSSSSHRINMGFSSFSKSEELLSQTTELEGKNFKRGRDFSGLSGVAFKCPDIDLKILLCFRLFKAVQFFNRACLLKYAN